MKNFEILNAEQLLDIKGGGNEVTNRDNLEDCIV